MKKIIVLLCLNLFVCSLVQAEWKIEKAAFNAKSVTKVGSGRIPDIDDWGSYIDAEFLKNRVEYLGSIDIREYDEENLSTRETHIENVTMLMTMTGIVARVGLVQDLSFPFRGLEGKTIASIFKSEFQGGKVGMGLGFLVGAYPNASWLINSRGVTIPNLERILRLDLNIGVEIAYVTMKFKMKETPNTAIVTVGTDSNNPKATENVSVEKVMNQVLGQ